jgi:carbon-monoxide dehydrogenase small subunit
MAKFSLKVNGKTQTIDAEADMPLLYALRNDLQLNGPKFGCGLSQCGACTVIMDGQAVKSCTILAVQAEGHPVTTIEGMGSVDALHPLQQAFWEKHGLQCGFCTPGMIMTASDLLAHNPDPSEEEIRDALEGNYCRCTGYVNIVAAVKHAAGLIREGAKAGAPA